MFPKLAEAFKTHLTLSDDSINQVTAYVWLLAFCLTGKLFTCYKYYFRFLFICCGQMAEIDSRNV
jgi:hypothetical protein